MWFFLSDQTQSRDRNPYKDLWKDGVLHYTEMGLKGDQSFSFMQNKTFADLEKYKVKVSFLKNIFLKPMCLEEKWFYREKFIGKSKKIMNEIKGKL